MIGSSKGDKENFLKDDGCQQYMIQSIQWKSCWVNEDSKVGERDSYMTMKETLEQKSGWPSNTKIRSSSPLFVSWLASGTFDQYSHATNTSSHGDLCLTVPTLCRIQGQYGSSFVSIHCTQCRGLTDHDFMTAEKSFCSEMKR